MLPLFSFLYRVILSLLASSLQTRQDKDVFSLIQLEVKTSTRAMQNSVSGCSIWTWYTQRWLEEKNRGGEWKNRKAEKPQLHFVYVVRCGNGALYTGYTTNVEKRIATHNAGKGARYTRAHLPVLLCASWSFQSKGDALRAERMIKGLPRARKEWLIEQALPWEECGLGQL